MPRRRPPPPSPPAGDHGDIPPIVVIASPPESATLMPSPTPQTEDDDVSVNEVTIQVISTTNRTPMAYAAPPSEYLAPPSASASPAIKVLAARVPSASDMVKEIRSSHNLTTLFEHSKFYQKK